jgi:hypothetical protein
MDRPCAWRRMPACPDGLPRPQRPCAGRPVRGAPLCREAEGGAPRVATEAAQDPRGHRWRMQEGGLAAEARGRGWELRSEAEQGRGVVDGPGVAQEGGAAVGLEEERAVEGADGGCWTAEECKLGFITIYMKGEFVIGPLIELAKIGPCFRSARRVGVAA